MKELPEYMNKILNFMADCEEKQGGLKKEEAYKLYKQELFDESLTAKANPSKLDSCVDQVKKKGTKYNAYAVCRAALKKNPKAVKDVVDGLIAEGKSAEEIHEFLLDNKFRGSLTALKKYMKQNPGLSEGKSPKDFDQVELQKGTQVEMEHTDDPLIAERIAMDHLTEDKDYYKKLAKMEAGACDISAENNPSIKPFHEIYLFAPEYNSSPLADKFLGKLQEGVYRRSGKETSPTYAKTGKKYKNEGIKFFEEIRNFGAMSANIFLEKMMGKKTGRGGYNTQKSETTASSGEVLPRVKQTGNILAEFQEQLNMGVITKGEAIAKSAGKALTRTEELRDVVRNRYMKLMISSIVFALIRPLFKADREKLEALLSLYPPFNDPNFNPVDYLSAKAPREAFVEQVVETVDFQLKKGIDIFDIRELREKLAIQRQRRMAEKKKGR